MELQKLIERLPNRSNRLTEEPDAPPGVMIPSEEAGAKFIAPDLQLAEGFHSPDANARVILISASAAVGKTTLATNLARITGNPYWDLGKFSMGSGFFSGILSTSYGVRNYAAVIDELRSGYACLILDAADEAIVASTSTNYNAALQNLAEIIVGAKSPNACAVILGRPETIIDTHLYLSELDVDTEVLEVAYFSESAAQSFVHLKSVGPSGEPVNELDQFVESFFTRVREAFGSEDWQSVGPFLGYAPVLDSMALFATRFENPFKELRRFAEESSRTWSLIAEMLDRILERETNKFAASFGGNNAAKQKFAASAYSTTTQIQWLLADDLVSLHAEPDLDLAVKPEWLDDIDQRLRDQFEDHPFLKSVNGDHARNVLLGFTSTAFRDYVLGRYLTNPDRDYLEVLVAYWLQPEVVPSPMLSRFIRSSPQVRDGTILHPESLLFLIDSHTQQVPETSELAYVEWRNGEFSDLESVSMDDQISISFENDPAETAGVLIQVDRECVRLGRSAAYSVFSLPGSTVMIGQESAECDLGPRLSMQVEKFVGQSSEVHINNSVQTIGSNAGNRSNGVTLWTDRIDGVVRRITGAREEFAVRVPTAPHPWQPFRVVDSPNQDPAESDILFTALALRRIAVWFGRGGMRFSREKMDAILSKGRASIAMFEYLKMRGYIWIDEPYYRLDGEFNIGSIRNLDFSDQNYKRLINEAVREIGA
ncbi:hypothetical protein [Rhodococcus gannanensis]|uniref:Uncharacterized protein n=1 Tax=Rhodococcus gannanensis TaxID=1960308 RepID=A0ABW4P3H5_9NOCA